MALKIGISGGHHESTAVAYHSVRSLISPEVKGLPINPHNLERSELLTRLDSLMSTLAQKLGFNKTKYLLDSCSDMVLALPGAGTAEDWQFAQDLLNDLFSDVGCKNQEQYRAADDTWAGLYAQTLQEKGICAFAGSGASVYVALGNFVSDKRHKIDGWGPVIGDFGSAFQLVTDFFRRLGRSLDEDPEGVPPLFKKLQNWTKRAEWTKPHLPCVGGVQRWFDDQFLHEKLEWRVTFASLARAITEAADRKTDYDEMACELVRECAKDMAKSISIAVTRFKPATYALPVVFQGGMFRNSRRYLETVLQALGPEIACRAQVADFEPVYGALFMASGPERFKVKQLAIDSGLQAPSVRAREDGILCQ